MKTFAELMEQLDAKLSKLFINTLSPEYLYNTDQRRHRVNLTILIIMLVSTDIFSALWSTIVNTINYHWIVAIGLSALGVLVIFLLEKQKTLKGAVRITTIYVIANIWVQFAFSPISSVNVLTFLLYPLIILFFLGNEQGLKLLLWISLSLVACMWIWRNSLAIVKSSELLAQFIISFIAISVLAVLIEFLHAKMLDRLTSLTHRITDDSYSDPLTNLLTRRAFNERFAPIIEEDAAQGKPIFVVMCDIDHFKSVNDTYGHNVGDEVLQHVAGILSKYAMGKDICFRWGGEEFLIFLHERTLARAVDAANRIRVVLEYTHCNSTVAGTVKVTMSFGLHQFDPTMSMEKNISVADGYLYTAKHSGRNRVEYAKQ